MQQVTSLTSNWQKEGFASPEERVNVERWIQRHNLTSIGDPVGLDYSGYVGYFPVPSHTNRAGYLRDAYPSSPWNDSSKVEDHPSMHRSSNSRIAQVLPEWRDVAIV